MGRPSNCSCDLVLEDQWRVVSRWTGAGAADLTKVQGKGIVSIVRQGAVGEHRITFQDVGGRIIGVRGFVHTADNVAPLVVKEVQGSYSAANKTVDIEIWDLAVPGKLDAPADSLVDIEVIFAHNNS